MILHSIDQVLLSGIDIPERMNNPLDYQPHPLCIAVCKELQTYLSEREDWREEIDKGKMFGVLIVENAQPEPGASEIGYLAAYSGQIGGRSDWDDFVPAVFDYLQPDGYFKTHETEISDINQRIKQLEGNKHIKEAKSLIQQLQEKRKQTIAAYQEKMKEAKAKRDARRKTGNLTTEEEAEMVKESQFMKAELRRLKKSLSEKTTLETEYEVFQADILRLKQLRKSLSDTLQQWLFSQFLMQNHEGESKDLLEIFRDAALRDYPQATLATSRIAALKMVPPAGSGECCEPKLLQYAYLHGYRPLQMAMFWWGESPKEEIRHHLQFYPACNGKCKPILHWMLPDGVFDSKIAEKQALETLYEDDQLAVIYKPSGLLSVPGKDSSQPSVYSIMRKKYPAAGSPLIVHRLDMATSGLMIIAKTDFAYHRLQKEFLHHRVQKKYIAIIGCKDQEACDKIWDSSIASGKQKISLPLMPDYLDRPRQIVNHAQGKEAITEYEVLDRIDATHLRLALYPKTGRTHQLRVHCAHHEGLNAPILGDPLYGNEKASRLHLHAEEITFEHPLTGKEINIKREADFIYP